MFLSVGLGLWFEVYSLGFLIVGQSIATATDPQALLPILTYRHAHLEGRGT